MGNKKAGVTFSFVLQNANAQTDGWSTVPTLTATSDVNGLVQISLVAGAKYRMSTIGGAAILFTTGMQSTYALPEFVSNF